MHIVLYGSIAWRHPLGFAKVIDWAQQFGWDAVDARGMSLDVPGDVQKRIGAFGYDMLGPRQIRKSARQELRRRLEDAGKPLLGIYCSSSVNLPDELGKAYRELFREYLELGADLGARWIRSINNTTDDGAGGQMSETDAYQRTVDGLREMGAFVKQLGIGLLLENNENTIPADAETLRRLQDDVKDVCRVGIAYDPVNAYFQGLDPAAGLDVLAGRIDILHLKNVKRWQEKRWDYMPRGDFSYEWKPLAEGDLDWSQLLAKAKSTGFDGPLVFEYVNPFKGMPRHYWDTLPEPEEAAQREAKYLRGILTSIL